MLVAAVDSATLTLSVALIELPGLRVSWYSWWQAPSVADLARGAGLSPDHANWLEAFPFCRVAELPAGEKPLVRSARLLNADETRAWLGDGVYSGPYAAPDALKTRSIMSLSMIFALNRPHELEIHLRAALRNGISPAEIKELLLHGAVYCGAPAALDGFRVARKVLAERRARPT